MRASIIILIMAVSSVSVFAATQIVTDGYFSSITIDNNDTLLMTGGGGGSIWGRDNSIIDIRGTSWPYVWGESGIDQIVMNDNSQLYFSGGSLRYLGATGNATVILTGGWIKEINAYYPAPRRPEPYYDLLPARLTYEDYYLSGLWLDGSAFNIKYTPRPSEYTGQPDDHPRTGNLMLFGLGGVVMRRKRNRTHSRCLRKTVIARAPYSAHVKAFVASQDLPPYRWRTSSQPHAEPSGQINPRSIVMAWPGWRVVFV